MEREAVVEFAIAAPETVLVRIRGDIDDVATMQKGLQSHPCSRVVVWSKYIGRIVETRAMPGDIVEAGATLMVIEVLGNYVEVKNLTGCLARVESIAVHSDDNPWVDWREELASLIVEPA